MNCHQHGTNYADECAFCKTIEGMADASQKLHDAVKIKSDGGPSSYYDLSPGWVTWNDVAEHKAKTQWGPYSLHMKDLSKAMMRFGIKDGTTQEYDIHKIFYSAVRLKIMQSGKQAAKDMLQAMLDDPQMK